MSRFLLILLAALLVSGCATTVSKKDYNAFRSENPHSILVVPAVNKTVNVDAPDYFLSTIARPIAERGYYVFPVRMVKQLMDDDGLSDADLVHESDPVKLASLFGADSVLYVSINEWDAKYVLISTTVTVDIDYVLKSGKSGQTLWKDHQRVSYDSNQNKKPDVNGWGVLFQMINAAVQRAAPNFIPLTRSANSNAIYNSGHGLPAGPYDQLYLKDKERF